ncbi:MAG: basic amino acid ABC transporter substrate-binding protein [Candidatus Eisenbacteria bacterium]|nr:basic amino acid ABC transporter substrate-binding protein [Candidatus Eisenbacteria bacterium]MCC7140851.1 basic amino acid ABC transporter substrate-binding protein [Candidatus Eisenbacteria bacterium]
MKFGVAVLLLFAFGASACSKSEQSTLDRVRSTKVLRVGTDATYPPFESIDPTTRDAVGFDIDLMRALARHTGAEAEFLIVPFDGIIAGLKTGKYDAIISAMTITPERAEQVLFTTPYSSAGQSIAVRADEAEVTDLAGLSGRKIGVQLGTTGEMEARKVAGAEVVSFDAIGNAFRDLENGNVAAVIADTPTARIFQREHRSIKLVGQALTHEEYGIAIRLEDASLKAALDRGIDALRTGGELGRLEIQWGFADAK